MTKQQFIFRMRSYIRNNFNGNAHVAAFYGVSEQRMRNIRAGKSKPPQTMLDDLAITTEAV